MVKRHVLEEVLFKFARQRQRSKWSSLQNQIGNSPALFSNRTQDQSSFHYWVNILSLQPGLPAPHKKNVNYRHLEIRVVCKSDGYL